MVSVITACYNSGSTISKAIESLLSQTDTGFEHIVIDGKSKDNTVEVVESYRKKYEKKGIKLTVISEKDQGMYDALNKGINLVSGEYVGILNGDDWYEENTIEIVHREAKPEIDVIMGASYTINGNNKFINKSGEGIFITSRHFNHGAMFVRKSCYESIGGYANDGNYYDDFMWYIKALKAGKKFKIIDDILYNFACGGMSTKKSFKEVFTRIKYRYACYRNNNCSRLYIVECVGMEFAKWMLARS